MRRLLMTVARMLQGFSQAAVRFPLTVLCLFGSTALTCYMISLHSTPDLLVQKLMFVFLVGAMLGITAQFAVERFPRVPGQRLGVYVAAAALGLGYYLIIAPATTIDYWVGARTAVAVFSLFSAFVWLPSFREKFDFNSAALIHFKSALTSVLYAAVLSAGLAALFAAVDILLFDIDSDLYGYMLAIVWLLFATIHYLSLLPRFNSQELTDRVAAEEASQYPRILEILVSQIAIPLVAAYTLVLFSYFVKIAVTRNWPIGQLGPMILGYSAAGLLIYVLASRLSNRLAVFYQRVFPKVLIPIVIMQLVSVYIRLQAYGVTESRYYVALSGILALVIGIVLSRRAVTKNGIIALLAAGFAIFSVIPPVDAFTVSRVSQVARLEQMLQSAGILVDGQLHAKADADLTVRLEATNILNYLDQRGHLQRVSWLPAGFQPYRDMRAALGFEPTYTYMTENGVSWFLNLEPQNALPVADYDVLLQLSTFRSQSAESREFTVGGKGYRVVLQRASRHEAIVSVQNAAGQSLLSTGLEEFVNELSGPVKQSKEMLPVEQMSLDVAGEGYRLRIIFQSVHATYGSSDDRDGIDYTMYVLVAVSPER